MLALLSIFCSNSSMVTRGTRSEGAGLDIGSGANVTSGEGVGADLRPAQATRDSTRGSTKNMYNATDLFFTIVEVERDDVLLDIYFLLSF